MMSSPGPVMSSLGQKMKNQKTEQSKLGGLSAVKNEVQMVNDTAWTTIVKGKPRDSVIVDPAVGISASGANVLVHADQREKRKIKSQECATVVKNEEKDSKEVLKASRILPCFSEMSEFDYDRIVVSPTHFNKKVFEGFISLEESQIISEAIGLKNHHGTTFTRDDSGELLITFKLTKRMSLEEIKESIHKYFWFEKSSRAGFTDVISGVVIHPDLDDKEESHYKNVFSYQPEVKPVRDSIFKELRIEWSNYELTEKQICGWVELYGSIESEIEEEAVTISNDRENVEVGTGVYLVKVKLKKMIPNLLPIHGKVIKITYNGVKSQCKRCFGYHRNSKDCTKKKSFSEFANEFTLDNPTIPQKMIFDETDWQNNGNKEERNEDENEEPKKGNETERDDEIEKEEQTQDRPVEMFCNIDKEITCKIGQLNEEEIETEFELCAPSQAELEWIRGQHKIGKEMIETMNKVIKNRRSGSGLSGSR